MDVGAESGAAVVAPGTPEEDADALAGIVKSVSSDSFDSEYAV